MSSKSTNPISWRLVGYVAAFSLLGAFSLFGGNAGAKETAREPASYVSETAQGRARIDSIRARFVDRAGSGSSPVILDGTLPGLRVDGQELVPEPPGSLADATRSQIHVKLPLWAGGWSRIEAPRSALAVSFRTGPGGTNSRATMGAGLVLYEGAAPGAGALVVRVSAADVEDYLVLEKSPDVPRVDYDLRLDRVAGLRLVANTLELLDASGTPRLRAASPFLVDSKGARHPAQLSIRGCAFDSNPAAPWGRPIVSPGASDCTLSVSWHGADVDYPAVLDPKWSATAEMVAPRTLHTGTRLKDGRVLVAGGYAKDPLPSELFDPGSDTWAATSPLNVPRFAAADAL